MVRSKLIREVDGKPVYWFKMKNKAGMQLRATNYGATVTSLLAPDKKGNLADVVLGHDTLDEYLAGSPYFGCTVGRYANRLRGARFELGGKVYQLEKNEGQNQLHGGVRGFDKRVWDAVICGNKLICTYTSPDGEEGYPGTLVAQVTLQLTEDNALDITYKASCDADTIVNMTNHSYFNLNGAKDTVLDHLLTIHADKYTPVDEELLPTGEIRSVAETPLDFTLPHKVGRRVFDKEYESMRMCNGYDHNYVLNGEGMRKAATVYHPASGRYMEAYTDQPAMQLYTAQMLEDGIVGHGGTLYGPFFGMCLEMQIHPDAPNQPGFPDAVLRKGDVYRQHTRYVFGVKKKD